MIKTLSKWHKSKQGLDTYLSEPCEIDEGLANYIGEVVAPTYIGNNLIQGGDPYSEIDGVFTYATVSIIGDKYFYLGVLPEFKQ